MPRDDQAASALAFSPDGCFLYSGGEDAMLSSWNMLDAADPDESDSFKVLNYNVHLLHCCMRNKPGTSLDCTELLGSYPQEYLNINPSGSALPLRCVEMERHP